MGIVRRFNKPWSPPLHIVAKQNGGWRPCRDYRRLNNATVPGRSPILHIQEFFTLQAEKTVFYQIDLVRGYYQIPIVSEGIAKTEIITLFGLHKYFRMPFCLKNAALTFTCLMDMVFQNLHCVFVYMVDILIANPSVKEHSDDIRLVCQRLNKFGLKYVCTCTFGINSIDLLGHRIFGAKSMPFLLKFRSLVSS